MGNDTILHSVVLSHIHLLIIFANMIKLHSTVCCLDFTANRAILSSLFPSISIGTVKTKLLCIYIYYIINSYNSL